MHPNADSRTALSPVAVSRTHRVRARALERRPSVCAVIPLFNYARYVATSIASVLAQDDVDARVLVIDDRSTDGGLDVVRRMAETDPRITVLANDSNRGHIPTVNRGMEAVDAEYVVKLDADDLLTPGSLARSAAVLDLYPSVGFVYGFPLVFSTPEPPDPVLCVRNWTIWPGKSWLELRCRRGTNRIAQPEVMIRRSTLQAAGKYRERLPHTSDFEMWLRLSAISDVARVNGPHQGCYRVHSESMTQTIHSGILQDVRERLRAFDSFFDRTDLPDAERLRRISHRTLAKEALGFAAHYCAASLSPDAPVAEYRSFAREAWPAADASREWRALDRLMTLGPLRKRLDPRVAVAERIWNVSWALKWRRWRWNGT